MTNTTYVSRDAHFHEAVFPMNATRPKPYTLPLHVSMPCTQSFVHTDEFVSDIQSNNASATTSTINASLRRTQRTTKPSSWL